MNTCDDEFTFKAGGQLRVFVTELKEGLLYRVDGLHPAEQRRVCLGDLKRDPCPFASVCRHRMRLFEAMAPAGTPTA